MLRREEFQRSSSDDGVLRDSRLQSLLETGMVESGTNARRREASTGLLDGRQGRGGQVRGFGQVQGSGQLDGLRDRDGRGPGFGQVQGSGTGLLDGLQARDSRVRGRGFEQVIKDLDKSYLQQEFGVQAKKDVMSWSEP